MKQGETQFYYGSGAVIVHHPLLPDGKVLTVAPNKVYMNSNTFYRFAIGLWGITEGVNASVMFAQGIISDALCSYTDKKLNFRIDVHTADAKEKLTKMVASMNALK